MPTLFQTPPSPQPAARQGKKEMRKLHPAKPLTQSTMGPLTAFSLKPTGVRFETQEAREIVLLFLRQHIIVNFPWVLLTVVLLLAPTVIFPLALSFIKLPFTLPVGYIIIGTLFWYVFTFGFALANFLHWFFNIYIVTNERIVDIDFIQLLYKQFSEARIAKIQDISYKTSGLLATIFDYGNVYVQTAGELPNFEFMAVPHPEQVVQVISETAEQARKNGL